MAFSTAEISKIRAKQREMSLMRTLFSKNVPAQLLDAFLVIAGNEGIMLSEMAEILGTNMSTISRQVLDLSHENRARDKTGFGFIEDRRDPESRRITRYYLTPKGVAVMRALLNQSEE